MKEIFSTPRPVPSRLLPALAGTAVIGFALPVFAIAGWSLRGWALAAVLWIAGQALTVLLTRVRNDPDNVAGQAVVGIGTTFRAMAVGVPLVVVTAAKPTVGLAAALLYACAYTLELALGLSAYFAQQPTRGRVS